MAKIVSMSKPAGKIWKVLTLVAIVMIIWGGVYLVPFLFNDKPDFDHAPTISFVVVVLGFCLAVFARFGTWWFDE